MKELLPHLFLFLVGIEVAVLLSDQYYPIPKVVFAALLVCLTLYGILATSMTWDS